MADPGFPIGGACTHWGVGVDLRRRHFSVKMYAKMKELGPIGGGVCPATPLPRSANDHEFLDVDEIKGQYAAIIMKVESKQTKWSVAIASAAHQALQFRTITLNREALKCPTTGKDKTMNPGKTLKGEDTIYCSEYNKTQCKEKGDHWGRFNNKKCMKRHICKTCFKANKTWGRHSEADPACPLKQ